MPSERVTLEHTVIDWPWCHYCGWLGCAVCEPDVLIADNDPERRAEYLRQKRMDELGIGPEDMAIDPEDASTMRGGRP